MSTAVRGVFWSAVYGLVALGPLIVARLGEPVVAHGFWLDLSVALALSGLAILALQFGLVARLQRVSAPFGMDALHQFHRQISYVAVLFLVAHPVVVFVAEPGWLVLLTPQAATREIRLGALALFLLLVLVVTSLLRKRLRLSYEIWQLLHGGLALGVIGVSIAHALSWNRYSAQSAQRLLWLGIGGTIAAVVLWQRLIRPLLHLRRPWRVAGITEERGDAWTVTLEPDGHEGFSFQPGQFAWVLLGRSPFRFTQHPFSISSSAEVGPGITMTIKARGDFTRTVRSLEPGTRAYVDGPHGMFTPDRNEGPGFVFVAGGVGITPIISMLRTLRDREDVRPCWLFYGNADWESVTCREELGTLAQSLNLQVIHCLERPPPDWSAETGFVDEALLRRHLPERYRRLQVFVCGPVPMMDSVEDALVAMGIPDEQIHSERFDMV